MLHKGDIVWVGNQKFEVIEFKRRNEFKAMGLEPMLPILIGYGVLAKCLDSAGDDKIDMSKQQYFLDIDITHIGEERNAPKNV